MISVDDSLSAVAWVWAWAFAGVDELAGFAVHLCAQHGAWRAHSLEEASALRKRTSPAVNSSLSRIVCFL